MSVHYVISWKKGAEEGTLSEKFPTTQDALFAYENGAKLIALPDEVYWITRVTTDTTEEIVGRLRNPKATKVIYDFQGFGKTNGFFTIDTFPTVGDARAFAANYPKSPGGTYRIVEITTKVIG